LELNGRGGEVRGGEGRGVGPPTFETVPPPLLVPRLLYGTSAQKGY